MGRQSFMAKTSAFKSNDSGDEVYSGTNEFIEVVDVEKGVVEIAFDHVRNERIYLKFDLHQLIKAVMLYGAEP